jgi:hypothetical protein
MYPPSSAGDTTSPSTGAPSTHAGGARRLPALVIAWSKQEPQRVGELALLGDVEQGVSWVPGRHIADDPATRRVRFPFGRHRSNVATSRARCVCILVGNPRLFEPECRTPEQMRMANASCAYLERATIASPAPEPVGA